jgi:UDP-N-acetylmuramoyl-L-alanyl-D-glutamate--2,6-diaminopimelate ligase
VNRGAVAVASDRAISPNGTVQVRTGEPRRFLAQVANRFYDFPARSVTLVGVTGTNGKTTTTYLIRAILQAAGERSGLIGTIRHYDGQEWIRAANTTPESLDIVQLLAKLRAYGIRFCVTEVSSHAIALDRVAELDFKVGVFTNLSQDHLDFHKTIEDYKATELRFFEMLGPSAWVVYNADDPVGLEVKAVTRARALGFTLLESSSANPMLRAQVLSATDKGTQIELFLPDAATKVSSSLIGRHNVANILAAAGAGYALGIPISAIRDGIERLKAVPGRLQRVDTGAGLSVFVDYAHSPDALASLIRTARPLTQKRVIVVFGCGGNRDKGKRPIMGKIATDLADLAIITSDNPRDEEPEAIVADVVAGIQKSNYETVVDRYEAIKRALRLAVRGDIVLIAGKGHEDYQIIGKERRHFDDAETVQAILR